MSLSELALCAFVTTASLVLGLGDLREVSLHLVLLLRSKKGIVKKVERQKKGKKLDLVHLVKEVVESLSNSVGVSSIRLLKEHLQLVTEIRGLGKRILVEEGKLLHLERTLLAVHLCREASETKS